MIKVIITAAAALLPAVSLAEPSLTINSDCFAEVTHDQPIERVILRKTGGATLFKTNLHGTMQHTYGEAWTSTLAAGLQVVVIDTSGSRSRIFIDTVLDDLDACLTRPEQPIEPDECPLDVTGLMWRAHFALEVYAYNEAMNALVNNYTDLDDGRQNLTSTPNSCTFIGTSLADHLLSHPVLRQLRLIGTYEAKLTDTRIQADATVVLARSKNGHVLSEMELESFHEKRTINKSQYAACYADMQVLCEPQGY